MSQKRRVTNGSLNKMTTAHKELYYHFVILRQYFPVFSFLKLRVNQRPH